MTENTNQAPASAEGNLGTSSSVKQPEPEVAVAASEPAQEAPADNPLSDNFAKLMKQEKYNSELRKQLESERKKVEQERKELETFKNATYNTIEQNKNVPVEAREVAMQLKQLQDELRKREVEAEEARYKSMERKLDSQIDKVIKDEDFDIIDKLAAQAQVKSKLTEHFEKTGKAISVKEACNQVAEELADKFNKIKDSKFLQPKQVVKEEPVAKTSSIVNKMGQIPAPSKKLSDEDRIAAAANFLRASKK